MRRKDSSHIGKRLAKRLRAQKDPTNHCARLLVALTEERSFYDRAVHAELVDALFEHSLRIVGIEDQLDVLWACIRRAGAGMGREGIGRLAALLEPQWEHASHQAVFQRIVFALEMGPPVENDLTWKLREAVDSLALHYVSDEYLGAWPGRKAALAWNAAVAAITLRCPSEEELSRRVLSLHKQHDDGSVSWFSRFTLQKFLGMHEILRPDLRPRIDRMWAEVAGDPKRCPYPHHIESERRMAVKRLREWKPEKLPSDVETYVRTGLV